MGATWGSVYWLSGRIHTHILYTHALTSLLSNWKLIFLYFLTVMFVWIADGHFFGQIWGKRGTGKSPLHPHLVETLKYTQPPQIPTLLFYFVPNVTKLSALMISRLTHTGRAVLCRWTAEWSSLVTSATLCTFFLTQFKGYSTTGRTSSQGPQPLLDPGSTSPTLKPGVWFHSIESSLGENKGFFLSTF